MKLLLFSDLHCDADAARRLLSLARDVDVAVGAGDFATCRRDIHLTVDVLQYLTIPTVLVPGNAESFEELRHVCENWKSAHVLHGTGARIAGVEFFGLGGAVPETPFGSWSYDFSEQQAAELLADCPAGGVLVSHSPPKGTLDVSGNGESIGSESVRNTMKSRKPKLLVCGHIHACAGRHESAGDTTVVNAGPNGVIWELA
jgi:Icc-related predicted phosphoesterase